MSVASSALPAAALERSQSSQRSTSYHTATASTQLHRSQSAATRPAAAVPPPPNRPNSSPHHPSYPPRPSTRHDPPLVSSTHSRRDYETSSPIRTTQRRTDPRDT